MARFLGHLRMKYDLQQEIAKFVLEVDHVISRNRISDFRSFFDRVGSDGREGLFEIPGAAAAWGPQRGHQGQEIGDFTGSFHAASLLEL